jgi:cell division protein FtsB
MKNGIVLLLLFFNLTESFAIDKDSLFIRLNKVMDNKEYYIKNKEQNIQKFKQVLTVEHLLPEQVYDINFQLYNEYRKYQSDSAIHYVLKNQEIANQLGREPLKIETDLQLSWLYLIKGMYIESLSLLENIRKEDLPEKLVGAYYETFSTLYSQYNNSAYFLKSEQYRDSLLLVLDPMSFQYRLNYAAKLTYSGQDAEKELLALLEETTDKNPERGLIAYLLGYIHKRQQDLERSEYYFMVSAVADIENCIKENASFLELALIYDETGNIDQAHRFMQTAVDDALFCNIDFRISKTSSVYSIINAAYQEKERKQKAHLQILVLVVSILLVFLAAGIVYIYRQMHRLSSIRKELYRTNRKLSELNNDLTTANDQLKESNLIKEEYIAHFFDLCSTYIDKLENYRKTLNKHASNKHWDELMHLLRSTSLIETELEELYKKFDLIFLTLYPSFVEEFNALQTKEEPVSLKPGELLNTELRIFALIRLGITDSVKIAGFLRYSISTIYNYRVKARNNAVVAREEFEERVMKIGNYTQNS